MSSAKWRPFCLGLNVLKHNSRIVRCQCCAVFGCGFVSVDLPIFLREYSALEQFYARKTNLETRGK